MALTKEKKEKIIEDVRKKLTDRSVIYFINYKGLEARKMEKLRKSLQEEESNIMVIKKTLAKIAFEKEKIDFDPEELEGEVAFVFGFGDIIAPAKIIDEFADTEKIEVLGAILNEKILNPEKVNKLAELPSKDQLRAQLVSTIAAPASGFMGVLEGNIKGLLTVLERASKK